MVYVSLEERQRYDRDMERKTEFDAAAEEQYYKEEVAMRLFAEGVDTPFISRVTGLTEAEIEALREGS